MPRDPHGESLPFRTKLNIVSPTTDAGHRRRMAALRMIARNTIAGEDESLEILQWADEELLWLLVQSRALRSNLLLDGSVRIALCNRALADAAREGVLWTPLLDALGERRILPGDYPTWHPPERPVPSAVDVASALIPWIQAQNTPQALQPLFEFRTPEVRGLAARYATCVDEEMFGRLGRERFQRDLALNHALSEPFREQLAKAVWEVHKREMRKRHRGPELSRAQEVLGLMALHPNGLPEPVREPLFRSLVRQSMPSQNLLEELFDDPTLSPRDAARLFRKLRVVPRRMSALFSGTMDERGIREALKARDLATEVVGMTSPPPEWLDIIEKVQRDVLSSGLRRALAARKDTPMPTLRRLAQRAEQDQMLGELVEHERARSDRQVRKILLAAPHVGIARKMLPHATSEEYPDLVAKVLEGDVGWAIEALVDAPPPEGTVLPEATIAKLLEAPHVESRLQAITLLNGLRARG